MAFSGFQKTRQGLIAIARSLYGSFAGKAVDEGVDCNIDQVTLISDAPSDSITLLTDFVDSTTLLTELIDNVTLISNAPTDSTTLLTNVVDSTTTLCRV